MTAYCRFFRKITKYSPHYLMFGAPCLIPPIDCMYETLQNHLFSTPSDYNGKLKKDLQLCHKLLRSNMEVAKDRQKKPTTIKSRLDQNIKLGPGLFV